MVVVGADSVLGAGALLANRAKLVLSSSLQKARGSAHDSNVPLSRRVPGLDKEGYLTIYGMSTVSTCLLASTLLSLPHPLYD